KEDIIDPKGKIDLCWENIGEEVLELKRFLQKRMKSSFARILIELDDNSRSYVISRIWGLFKKLLPICMGRSTFGLVGSSKILFSVIPEIALPIDTAQWRKLFRTVDYSDILLFMYKEIIEWEEISRSINISVIDIKTIVDSLIQNNLLSGTLVKQGYRT
ncbi:MAG: hypothetical protein ACFFDI_29025, partial [Promethearchaeota archaeon]